MRAGDVVGELAARLDDDGHAGQLGAGQLVLEQGSGKHRAVGRIVVGCFVGGLHHADGPSRGLEATVLKALHLKVKAPPQTFIATD
jgi:hypothetical protein